MSSSGVVPSHRRRGIYTALLAAVQAHVLEQGMVAIRSQHSVFNNPVIIAKLRAGFTICGLSQSSTPGTLVEMVLHLTPARDAMFRRRSMAYVQPETAPAADAPTAG